MNQIVRIYQFFLIVFLVLVFTPSFSQNIIRLSFKEEGLQLQTLKKKEKKLLHGENYRLQIDGVNNAHVRAVINPKSFNLQSNISEPLKVLFPGDGTNLGISESPGVSVSLFTDAKDAFDFLIGVDTLSKIVYDTTKFNPSPDFTRKLINNLGLEPKYEEGKIIQKTEESILLISYFFEKYTVWFDKYLEKNDSYESFFEMALKLKSMKNSIDKDDFLNKAAFLEKSMKAKPEVFTSGFKAVKDGIDLQVSILDTFKKDTLYKGEIEFVNYKMWNFDFSTGFIFNRLVDVPYYLGPSAEGKKEILSEDHSKWDIAIGGMAHLTYKLSGFLSFGPQIGIGISILDAKPRYSAGVGLLLGRKGKVAINGGVAFGKVKELSNQVEEINGKSFVPESITTGPTFDRFDYSGYFGISYNLTKKSF
jgi:hypothetical protein